MAGIGIGPEEFAALGIEDPEARAAACARLLEPRLRLLSGHLASGVSRVMGRDVEPLVGTAVRRRGGGIGEAFVSLLESARATKGTPLLLLAVSQEHLHARVTVRGDSRRVAAMSAAVAREAPNLARRGKPFRRLRSFAGWDFEHLPEVVPAGSAAFWVEVAADLGGTPGRPPLLDLGTSWPREEARNLAFGDVLGAFRDLAPLFKLLANAG